MYLDTKIDIKNLLNKLILDYQVAFEEFVLYRDLIYIDM